MDNEMESNKRDHKVEITDIAISKVPYVRYREIPEEYYETLHQLARIVLELARDHNDSNETAITYSLDDSILNADDAELAVSYGDEHSVAPFNNTDAFHMVLSARDCVVIILHNHPSLSKISLSDVGYLFGYETLKMIVAVTNMGSINYIVKTDSYDRDEGLLLYREAVTRLGEARNLREKQEATDYFLNNCFRVGLIFEDK